MFEEKAENPFEIFQQEIKNPWEMFEKRLETGGASGQFYETKLAMLMLLQGVTKKRSCEIDQFYLANNMKNLGYFDDVALKYKYLDESGKEKSKVIFLQVKHKTNPLNAHEFITLHKLLSDRNAEFALKEYFSSFIEVKKRFNEKHENDPLFEGDFKDCDFVIYTNALPHNSCTEKGSLLRRVEANKDYVLNLGEDCSYYKLVYGENKELDQKVKDVLEYSSDCKKLAKALVEDFFSSSGKKCAELTNKGVIKKYQLCLAEKVIQIVKCGEGKVSELFLDDERSLSLEDKVFKDALFHEMSKIRELSGKSRDELKAILQKKLIKIPKCFDQIYKTTEKRTLPADSVSDQDIEEFRTQLKLFLGQPSSTELREVINAKIQESYKITSKKDVVTIFSKVNKYVEQWWMEQKYSYYLTEKFDYFNPENIYLDNRKRPSALNLPQLWHVPPQNDHFVGRRALLDRLSDLLNINMSAHVVACHGLGRVGKTQLVLQFAWNNLNNYNGIIWLDATDRNTFANEYIALGHHLNIIRYDEENQSIEILAKQLKIWLEDRDHIGWLMICDNVPSYEEVADLLPTRGCQMLFTCRYDFAWPQSEHTILVDVFDPEESRSLVESILSEDLDGQSLDLSLVEELSETLGHLPLALAQACVYIKKAHMRIDDYLKLYKTKKEDLMSSEVLLETNPAGCSRENIHP